MPHIFWIFSTKLSRVLFLFHDLVNVFLLWIYTKNREHFMQIMIKKDSACHVLSSEVRQSISFFSISIRFQLRIKIDYMFTNRIRVEEYSLSCFHMYQSLFDCFFRCYGYHHHCFFLSSLFFVIKNRINTLKYINKRFFYEQTINNSCTETIKLAKLLFRCVYTVLAKIIGPHY